MLGPIIIIAVILVMIPVGVAMTGGVVAGILGWFLRDDAEQRHEGSELVDLS